MGQTFANITFDPPKIQSLVRAGGNFYHSDENPGTLTADSSLTRPFVRHFDKQPQKVDVKNVKKNRYDTIAMIFLTKKSEIP